MDISAIFSSKVTAVSFPHVTLKVRELSNRFFSPFIHLFYRTVMMINVRPGKKVLNQSLKLLKPNKRIKPNLGIWILMKFVHCSPLKPILNLHNSNRRFSVHSKSLQQKYSNDIIR